MLPTPSVQANNLVRFVGDEVMRTGEPMKSLPISFGPAIGAPSTEFARCLTIELAGSGVLRGMDTSYSLESQLNDVNLTLRGWRQYDAERRGKVAGNYGFAAFRFGNAPLDGLLKDTVKPGLRRL
jgi:hypothetical protein